MPTTANTTTAATTTRRARSRRAIVAAAATPMLLTAVLAGPAIAQDTSTATRPSAVDVRPTSDRVEALAMRCRGRIAHTDEGRVKVARCAWRPAGHPRAVGYQLWRLLPGGHRELVVETRLDDTVHLDRLPADTRRARYVVLALDENGTIVGRSRAKVVTF